jgi:hypothetical protein
MTSRISLGLVLLDAAWPAIPRRASQRASGSGTRAHVVSAARQITTPRMADIGIDAAPPGSGSAR